MSTIFFGLITLAFIAGVIIFILVMIELKGSIKELRELIRTTERTIKPTLIELQETLKSLRYFTDNINEVTEDVRVFSGSIKEVGESVRIANENVRHLSSLLGNIGSLARAELSGVKAGIGAGFQSLLKSLLKRDQVNP